MVASAVPALAESMTMAEARAQLLALEPQVGSAIATLPEGAPLVVDASAVQHFDSSALAVLLECRRTADQRHRSFAVRGLPPRLRELARLYGVSELLPEAGR